jgi:HAMP domain-containing protein
LQGKITLWRDVRWSSTERLARHVMALELSGTRTDIIYTRKEVEWRQQKLDRQLKKMRNRLASAEAKAKKAKKNDTDKTG